MSLRLFAAIAIPGEAAVPVLALQTRGVPGARWRPRDNLHLTLRFFGEVTERVAEALDAALEEVAVRSGGFSLTLKGTGSFGGAEPHTLFVKTAPSAALEKLAADCERAARRAGLKPEARKFTPHVTIAYLRASDVRRVQAFEVANGLFAAPPFRVEEFGLYSSAVKQNAPSLYRLEASYPLGG